MAATLRVDVLFNDTPVPDARVEVVAAHQRQGMTLEFLDAVVAAGTGTDASTPRRRCRA